MAQSDVRDVSEKPAWLAWSTRLSCGRDLAASVCLALFGVCQLPAQAAPVWAPDAQTHGEESLGHAMVYDALRGQFVLFGVRTPVSYSPETWIWADGAWKVAATTGPSARYNPAMAYDSFRSTVVMHGGQDASGGYLEDTWEWDGTSWTNVSSAIPGGPGLDCEMSYDSQRGVMVLVSSAVVAGFIVDRTYEFSGTSWTQVSTAGPALRAGFSMAFDAGIGRVVLFGGFSNGGYSSDTWEWDGTSWALYAAGNPPARQSAAMCFDSQRGVLVMFGGWTQGPGSSSLPGTWERSGRTWSQVASTGPAPRREAAMAFDTVRQHALLYGGRDPGSFDMFDDTYVWDGVSWREFGTLESPSAAFDPARGNVVCFSDGETWTGDAAGYEEQDVAGPSVRAGHAMAFDGVLQQALLYGSRATGAAVGETWIYDGQAWTQLPVLGAPGALGGHAMCEGGASASILLFGGESVLTGAPNAATWMWSGTQWQSLAVSGPAARSEHAMAYDSGRQVAVLFGGLDANGSELGDTWEFDGTAWNQRQVAGPGPRYEHAMCYDSRPGFGRVLMHGGRVGNFSQSDTWSWDGTLWRPITEPGASLVSGLAMVHDSQRALTVCVGGVSLRGAIPGEAIREVSTLASSIGGTARAEGYGVPSTACLGSVAVPPIGAPGPLVLEASWSLPPVIGQSATLDVLSAPQNLAFVALGLSDRVTSSGQPLPISLDSLGMTGCRLWQSAEGGFLPVTYPHPNPPLPYANAGLFQASIPNASQLLGVQVYLQGFAPDAGANAAGFISSTGMRWTIGSVY